MGPILSIIGVNDQWIEIGIFGSLHLFCQVHRTAVRAESLNHQGNLGAAELDKF
jgi:hypothetical protein